jgi:hypothetical protein
MSNNLTFVSSLPVHKSLPSDRNTAPYAFSLNLDKFFTTNFVTGLYTCTRTEHVTANK